MLPSRHARSRVRRIMTSRQVVVVTRALSGARIREGEQLQVSAQSVVGPVTITYRTRYADEGFESPIPRELWAEVRGEADCGLDEAINAYWGAANAVVPALAVAGNTPIEDLDVHFAFDATPEEQAHEFFENFQPDEAGRPRHGRSLSLPETVEFLDALAGSDERDRLARACAFYREALRHLRPGQEVLFAVFLWMAVEALTKVALRRACAAEGCTDDELVTRWGLAPAGADEDAVSRPSEGSMARSAVASSSTATTSASGSRFARATASSTDSSSSTRSGHWRCERRSAVHRSTSAALYSSCSSSLRRRQRRSPAVGTKSPGRTG